MSKPKTLSASDIELRLVQARRSLQEIEHRYRALAFENVGQARSPAEIDAQEALATTRQDVARLEAALAEAQSRETAEVKQAQLAAFDEQDALTLAAYANLQAVADEGAAVVQAYQDWWVRFLAAEGEAKAQLAANTRVRRDLFFKGKELVVREITRLSDTPLPPGADAGLDFQGWRGDLTPLTDAVAGIVGCVRDDLASARAKRHGQA